LRCPLFFFTLPPTPDIYSLSLHDALPIYLQVCDSCGNSYDKAFTVTRGAVSMVFDSFECAVQGIAPECAHCGCRILGHGVESARSEEHTSELQSRFDLVCRLLLEKKNMSI